MIDSYIQGSTAGVRRQKRGEFICGKCGLWKDSKQSEECHF